MINSTFSKELAQGISGKMNHLWSQLERVPSSPLLSQVRSGLPEVSSPRSSNLIHTWSCSCKLRKSCGSGDCRAGLMGLLGKGSFMVFFIPYAGAKQQNGSANIRDKLRLSNDVLGQILSSVWCLAMPWSLGTCVECTGIPLGNKKLFSMHLPLVNE